MYDEENNRRRNRSKGIFGSRRRGRDQVSEQKRYGNGVFQNAVSRSGRVYDECSKSGSWFMG